jgi:CubicO group peptidase (beta-lactamase class C family)
VSSVVEGSKAAGYVEPGFEGVREAFEDNFATHGEVGAATAVYVQGRKVVDLWGGTFDAAGAPYDESTLQLIFSTTKGVTALAANILAQRGELDVDAPVAEYWPEFAAAGKGEVPVRWLLSHKVGLPYVDAPLTLEQVLAWDPVVEALAAMTPVWEPGTVHGYHAVTYGWLVGEVIRRITGRTVGQFVADEFSGPLGLDLWVGLPDDKQALVSPLTNHGPGGDAGLPSDRDIASLITEFFGADALVLKALGGVPGLLTEEGMFNRPEVRAAEMPAANGVSNARSLAKLYAAVIGEVEHDGQVIGPLLSADQLAKALEVQTSGPDQVLMFETVFGLGFMRSSVFSPYGTPSGFGHSGAGGSMAFADPEAGVAFGYVMNRMLANLAGDPRTTGLVKAVYDAIGVTPTFV